MPDAEKSAGSSRFAWLRTKRAIVTITILAIVSIILIVLGATNTIGPRSSSNGDTSAASTASDLPTTPESGDPPPGEDNPSQNHPSATKTKTKTSSPSPTSIPDWKPINSSTITDGTPLRVMSLGASLVKGEFSTGLVGFRPTVRDGLAALGVPVNMVGSQRYGDMLDNDLEAYGGNRVSQIHEHATHVVPALQPNLFLVHVGSNNVLQNDEVDVAGQHMELFINYLLKASPRSTVIFSTCLTNTVPNCEPKILDINRQYRDVIKKYAGKPVLLAEMHTSEGLPGRPQIEDIGPDGTHPLDHGYELMGNIFIDAVKEADSKGFLQWPEDNGLTWDGEVGRAGATVSTTELPPRATQAR